MSTALQGFMQGYHALFTEKIDPRSEEWLLRHPYVPFGIISCYLLFVLKLGPKFMEHRPPFEIRPIVIAYNVAQVVSCTYVFLKGFSLWIQLGYSLLCQPVDPTVNEMNDGIANLVFIYYVLKISDLLDTVFFILRKKFNHASFLHVYHHAGMVWVGWLGSMFSLNGHLTLLGIINSFVHTVMYSYYLYTSLFPKRKVSISIKKGLTILQLVQFCILIVHDSLPLFQPKCDVHKFWAGAIVVQYTFMVALFSDFYIKAYIKSPKKKEE